MKDTFVCLRVHDGVKWEGHTLCVNKICMLCGKQCKVSVRMVLWSVRRYMKSWKGYYLIIVRTRIFLLLGHNITLNTLNITLSSLLYLNTYLRQQSFVCSTPFFVAFNQHWVVFLALYQYTRFWWIGEHFFVVLKMAEIYIFPVNSGFQFMRMMSFDLICLWFRL